MAVPNITSNDVNNIIQNCEVLGDPQYGGQKIVFECIINDKHVGIKFLLASGTNDYGEDTDEGGLRCLREIQTLSICNSPYLVAMGDIPLSQVFYNGQKILFYSEEWINGYNLLDYINKFGLLSDNMTIDLGLHISYAIEELWEHHKIHRDIKPSNIMYDNSRKCFVLLDMGMVFDSTEDTLTRFGYLPGTPGYYSPEQFALDKKADLDFRSDLFCLGIVMYEASTGVHPFKRKGMLFDDIIKEISSVTPINPSSINNEISQTLESIVMRLLKKRPSERYRSVDMLRKALQTSII